MSVAGRQRTLGFGFEIDPGTRGGGCQHACMDGCKDRLFM